MIATFVINLSNYFPDQKRYPKTEDKNLKLIKPWKYISDNVMGGISQGSITSGNVQGRPATRLNGQISLDNNGGFIQMALNLTDNSVPFDASIWIGIEIDVLGNGETYDLRLRTDELTRPWQSFRSEFTAPKQWKTIRVLFTDMKPHRTDIKFNPSHLSRIGILAIGRIFNADIAVSEVRLYNKPQS
jgi:hypothetical protein